MSCLNERAPAAGIIILLVSINIIIVLFVHTAESQSILSAAPYPQELPFLEHSLIANGTVINGSVPFRSVDFPSYWFNANTRELCGNIDFDIGGPLALIFGDSLTLQGNFGAGTGNKLFGIHNLPAAIDKAIIFYVDRHGNIGIYVNNRSVMLRPGQEYSYNESETVSDGNGTIRIDYQHLYLNRGLIPRTSIQTRMVS